MPEPSRNLLQTITLVTADGRRLVYAGRPQIDRGDPPRVVDIVAGPPRPLPDGCSWEETP